MKKLVDVELFRNVGKAASMRRPFLIDEQVRIVPGTSLYKYYKHLWPKLDVVATVIEADNGKYTVHIPGYDVKANHWEIRPLQLRHTSMFMPIGWVARDVNVCVVENHHQTRVVEHVAGGVRTDDGSFIKSLEPVEILVEPNDNSVMESFVLRK